MLDGNWRARSAATFRAYAANADDYLQRHRDRSHIRPLLRSFADRLPEGPVLDLGCGPGFDAHQLRRWGHRAVGLDRTEPALRLARTHFPGPYVCADIRGLPFRKQFAGVWACASLLHLSRPEMSAVLSQICAGLVPGGVLHLSVKEGVGGDWDTTYGKANPRWFTFWSEEELDEMLVRAGFDIRERSRSGGTRTTWLRRLAAVVGQ